MYVINDDKGHEARKGSVTMEDIRQTVYDALKASTEKIAETIAECEVLEKKIESGRYNPQFLKDEIYPKRDTLRGNISRMCESALNEAKAMVSQYREQAVESNNLDPAQLTDDVKLLQPGIILKPQDIQGMLKRNEGNRTMLQVILRYAKENNIDTGGTYYTGGQEEKDIADGIDTILYYYKNWIDRPNAKEMLDEFFSI